MAVSKRLRFEILRRDNHTCRYCGASAPDVKLVVDHVTPEALGGRTEPENLVAACEPCNSGKSSIAPDSALVRDVQADAVRWSRAILVVTETRLQEMKERTAFSDLFYYEWSGWLWDFGQQTFPLPGAWEESVQKFYDMDLPYEEMLRAVRVTMSKDNVPPEAKFRYFCGVCWGMVRDIRESAADVFMKDLADEMYGED